MLNEIVKERRIWIFYFVVLFSFLSLILRFDFVNAEEQKVCCSETVNGDHCQYVDVGECEPGALQAAATCEQTSFCRLGCGFDQGSGKCFKNTPRFTCEQEGNCTWLESANCEIPQCQKGCCVLSSECSFITQLECKRATSLFEDVNMTFKEEIASERDCINQCRSFERGACVAPDRSCKFTTRESCPYTFNGTFENRTGPLVGFHVDKLCSHPQLGTECARQQYTGCLPDRDEVYWFDSCGNPENIYSSDKISSYNNGFVLSKEEGCGFGNANINNENCGNCDYSKGSICGLAPQNVNPRFGDYTCLDLSCRELTISDTTPATSEEGDIRKHGEGWCSYDGVPGFGRDFVGSRHYRRLCIKGKELTEPCKDFREEMCVQGIQGEDPFETQEAFIVGRNLREEEFIQGACRPNRFQSCVDIKNQFDCENLQQRDCIWMGKRVEGEDKQRQNKDGACAPLVSPGLKFWPDESTGETPEQDAKATCEKGNRECQAVFEKSGTEKLFGGRWECVANCQCLEKIFLQSANNYCKALGDCGAWFNIAGKFTEGGFIEDSKVDLEEGDVESFDSLVMIRKKGGRDEGVFSKFGEFFSRSAIPLSFLGAEFFTAGYQFGFKAAGSLIGPIQGTALSAIAGPEHVFAKEFIKTVAMNENTALGEAAKAAYDAAYAGAKGLGEEAAKEAGKKAFEKTIAEQSGKASLFGISPFYLSMINTALWAWTIYNLIDVLFSDTKVETVSVKCETWAAPTGGSDCEKCDQEGKECSEYRCKSLGQLCKLINPGTKDEKCVNSNPNDVTSPIISANPSVLPRGLTITEVANEGFSVNEKIEPFTPVTLGINTNEFSQCKYSNNHSMKFDDMVNFFGDGLFRKNHTITFSLPGAVAEEEGLRLTNRGKFTVYLRCQDGNGNKNNRDYYIRFEVKPGPDLTAPVIELTSIENGAFVPAGINQTLFTAFLNEPSECRWDDIDNDFDNMRNEFSCRIQPLPSTSIFFGLFDCNTVLDNIVDNKENIYFIRCKDQPGRDESERNVNEESFVFKLSGTIPLEITSVSPLPGTELFNPSPVLKVITAKGARNGIAICGYNFFDSSPQSAIDFLRTNSSVHEQPFVNLSAGNYNVFINCIDVAGNLANTTTSFTISVDTAAPQIAQIFTEGSILHIVTDEESTCEYSTSGTFTFGSGIRMTGENTFDHEATLESSVFYVKCRDAFGNEGSYTVFV